jgi:hypothetical protein
MEYLLEALALGLWVENFSTPFGIRGKGSGFSIYKGVSRGGGDSRPGTTCEEL